MSDTPINRRPISIRPTAVAGSFYPNNASQLNRMLDEYFSKATIDITTPKAIIAPHAGYIYSGQTAANIYAHIKQVKSQIKRVILLGPTHRVYVKGMALPTHSHFASPLGNVSVDIDSLEKINNHSFAQYLDLAHAQEHSLEVHLPFLQKALNDFTLVPILVGDATPKQVATALAELWGEAETLIVISSDLSHYLNYETACKIDSDTTRFIENLDYKNIGSDRACGCMPMRGLLKLAQQKNMSVKTVDLCNSGDTAGSKDRVVGYGAYALFETRVLNKEDRALIFSVINKSIEQGLKTGKAYRPETENMSTHLKEKFAVFVTLKLNGQLRGCIGTTKAQIPLINAVAEYAFAAAFSDPRFKPLSAAEYKQIEMSLSILTPAEPLAFNDEYDLIDKLRPGIDGLIISKNNSQATFLPVVWESLNEPTQFLKELKRKAGINDNESPDKAWRYTAEYYS